MAVGEVMEAKQIIDDIREFVLKEANISDSSLIEDHTDLFQGGLIDSLMIISIVLYCKEKYNCDINLNDDFENSIRTINGISSLIYKMGSNKENSRD
jgi:acyl carrier protein